MKISLGNLEKSRLTLSEKDMEHLLGGGGGVRCGCLYAGTPGGATHQANHDANVAAGLWTVPPDGSGSGSDCWKPEPHVEKNDNTTVVRPPSFPPIQMKP